IQSDDAATLAALSWTLRLKGVILDTVCRYRQTQQLLTSDNALNKRVNEYRALKRQLADASLSPPQGTSREQFQKKITEWKRQIDELEGDINCELAKAMPQYLADKDA